jgi:hypothetical protein
MCLQQKLVGKLAAVTQMVRDLDDYLDLTAKLHLRVLRNTISAVVARAPHTMHEMET